MLVGFPTVVGVVCQEAKTSQQLLSYLQQEEIPKNFKLFLWRNVLNGIDGK